MMVHTPWDNRNFSFGLAASLAVHAAVVGVWVLLPRDADRMVPSRPQVIYQKVTFESGAGTPGTRSSVRDRGEKKFFPPMDKLDLDSGPMKMPAGPGKASMDKLAVSKEMYMPAAAGPRINKKSVMPFVPPDKANDPDYLEYSSLVWRKIRAALSAYSGQEEGDVGVSFVISSSGQIKSLQLVSGKTSASPHLQKLCLQAIRNAGPFPAFGKDLSDDELPFGIVISFEYR